MYLLRAINETVMYCAWRGIEMVGVARQMLCAHTDTNTTFTLRALHETRPNAFTEAMYSGQSMSFERLFPHITDVRFAYGSTCMPTADEAALREIVEQLRRPDGEEAFAGGTEALHAMLRDAYEKHVQHVHHVQHTVAGGQTVLGSVFRWASNLLTAPPVAAAANFPCEIVVEQNGMLLTLTNAPPPAFPGSTEHAPDDMQTLRTVLAAAELKS